MTVKREGTRRTVVKLPPDGELAGRVAEFGGNLAAVARSYGCSRTAVWKRVRRSAALRVVVHDAVESYKDTAETALHRAVLAGEAWAVCFFLKCRAKDRGYVERQEVTRADGREIVLKTLAPGLIGEV